MGAAHRNGGVRFGGENRAIFRNQGSEFNSRHRPVTLRLARQSSMNDAREDGSRIARSRLAHQDGSRNEVGLQSTVLVAADTLWTDGANLSNQMRANATCTRHAS